MLLNKEQIFLADDQDFKVVDVPEWGGEIRLKALSVEDQLDYEEAKKSGDNALIVLSLLYVSCVDDNGKRLFKKDEIEKLKQRSTKVVLRLFNEALELNALNNVDLEEEAKNS